MLVEYFENISLYQKDRSREYILHEKDIIDFAKKWTPQPFHMDPEYAKTTRIGSLFAAGAHLFAICTKLTVERTPRPATIAGMGIDEMRFLNPGRPGDIFVLEREWFLSGNLRAIRMPVLFVMPCICSTRGKNPCLLTKSTC